LAKAALAIVLLGVAALARLVFSDRESITSSEPVRYPGDVRNMMLHYRRFQLHSLIRRFSSISTPLVNNSPADLSKLNRVAVDGLPVNIWTFPKRRPFVFGVGLNCVIVAAADCYAQSTEKQKTWDVRRTATFTCFGLCSGALSYYVCLNVFSKLCPSALIFSNLSWKQKLAHRPGQVDLVKQVALDMFWYTPMIYFPNFYMFKSLISPKKDGSRVTPWSVLEDAWSSFRENIPEDMCEAWSVWIPADFLCFAVPAWLRMPSTIVLNFGWTVILSSMRGPSETVALGAI